ncbi:MAG TPA: vitamin B12-dependent ribonucleotide reductase, partial [Acidimicrobiales bacterium]|nr:vitamin B12-dependent ribonucleotide reductase [Acidimicrobiales bacterium]
FTTPGTDPYETVTWERRDARITHWATGAVAFEQLGVEVPSGWSVNATNILAQKYFRGTLGTPEREWSLKQVADRVVGTIVAWGKKDGYFSDKQEAEAFEAELKWLIIHQRAAFNSPVWFNIGVAGVPQQASACQPYWSLVSTPDGLVPIGKLVESNAVGAKVYDANGVTQVVAVKANGRKPVLRLNTKAGHRLDVTPDHLVWRRSGVGTGRFVPAGTLRPGDQLTWHRTESWGTGEISSSEIAEAALAGLMSRGTEMTVPARLYEAPLPVAKAYLRSIFQAEGYVCVRERSSVVCFDMVSEGIVRGAQQLLARFGIFSRVRFKADRRTDRKGCWSLTIQNEGDRRLFQDEIGFIDPVKAGKLERSFENPGQPARDMKVLEIETIENLGEMNVYDIQTESGEYLSEALRVHNCFILAVEDSMDSILNWYVEEGKIFKGGSGAGINLSRIRSSKEELRGGGTASGPVSFMRGADASAGTIKSGGKTRRAAKMVVLNADHPDIEDFIWCKAIEERKARALQDAGFDMDLDGKDSHSIQYQNANNSVRVTDEFMEAVIDDKDWELRAIATGEVLKTMKARDLFRQIAKAAWECADPGMQFDTTINKWHTAPNTGRINASNPCSEYVHLDNSACNLASLNLLTFIDTEGTFDVEGFRAAIEVVFTGQEILVGNADYPTKSIGDTSRRFRQLGLGFANLGALLMAQGLPYDSDGGRAWAAAITALMTGHGYAVSGRTAARMGPFAGYHENREPMLEVLRMHRAEVARIDEDLVPPELLSAAQEAWDNAVETAETFGVRNSQCSVLAPTGTIGLLMDCDTTGVEPDLGLVKTKKLVGGGTMSIINQTVPRALRRLGYAEQEITDIVAYIDEHKSILGAPHITPDHLAVFACSMGDNTIHYRGHVRMMAAVQPFISGAISKCVTGETLVTTADGMVRIG